MSGRYKGVGVHNGVPQAEPRYVMQEWDKNCVMQALSKVLGRNIHELARYIVDNNIGGVTMISEMENGSVIKKVLADLGFQTLMEGGATWREMRPLVLNYGAVKDLRVVGRSSSGKPIKSRHVWRSFYAVYWRHKNREDWTNKAVQPGLSDHAFTLIVDGPTIQIPKTNDSTFDTSHNPLQESDFVSVFRLG